MHEIGSDIATGHTVRLTADAKRRHLYIIGKSGVGKTNLLRTLMLEDLAAGRGFCFLDPHGDEAERLADSTPLERFDDTIYFDPADLSHAVGYNPLEDVAPDLRPLAAEQVLAAFAHVWGLSMRETPRLLHILRNALRLLLDTPGSTLLGISKLLIDSRYRERLLRRCQDPAVRMFWEVEFIGYTDRLRAEATAPVLNKTGALASNPTTRNIVGQGRSTIHPRRLMDEGRVLICNLAKGRMGEETSALIGALLTAGFAEAAQARANIPESDRRDFTLYADEFQNFAGTTFAIMLAEARKHRLSLVLAHQYLSQVPESVQDAVVGTASTTVAFRCGAKDAKLLAPEFGLHAAVAVNDSPVTPYCDEGVHAPQALMTTPNFEAWLRTVEDGYPGNPRRIRTQPPEPTLGRLAAVRNRTRARYARPRVKVEQEVNAFFAA